MASASKPSPPGTNIEFPDQPATGEVGVETASDGARVDVALRSTEAALGQLTQVVIENIRSGGDVSHHIDAAQRDLRNALRQLGQARCHPREPL
jgi:hypothetical protein